MNAHERFYAFFQYIAHSEQGRALAISAIVAKFTSVGEDEYIIVDATKAAPDGAAFCVFRNEGPEPDVTFLAKIETYEEVLYGELNLVMAFTTGKIRSRGSTAKAMRMLPVFERCLPLYRVMLREMEER